MSNACGRLIGTIGSGVLYTYVGDDLGQFSGTDAVTGLAACFAAGTVSSLIAALITTKIDDDKAGLKCGSCWTLVAAQEDEEDEDEEADDSDSAEGRSDRGKNDGNSKDETMVADVEQSQTES